jgi:hypothetical protein
MGFFPQTLAALAAGSTVNRAALVQLDFTSGTKYLFEGLGILQTAGQDWLGFGHLVRVTGMEQASRGNAPVATFTLSGVDREFVNYASNSASEVKGRPLTVFAQFLADRMQPLDSPLAVYTGEMDVMRFSAQGPRERSITVTVESLFSDRASAPYSFLTDVDQKARYPGDRGLEFAPTLRNKTVNWLRG